jgi:acyl dehydratase
VTDGVTGPAEAFDLAGLDRPGEPVRYEVTEDALRTYADATGDAEGGPVFAIVPAWQAIAPASLAVASESVRDRVLHYEQDIRVHRPFEAGLELTTVATPIALLPRPNGTSLVIRVETRDQHDALVAEQFVTEFFRGVVAEATHGERAPDHGLSVDGDPLAEVEQHVAADQPQRYAEASGDRFAIHLDDAFARSVGLPGRIVHGLCTMALAGRAALEAAGRSDPREVSRLAVRFSAPLFPDSTLRTRVWRVEGGFGFESTNADGQAVLKDGRLELR